MLLGDRGDAGAAQPTECISEIHDSAWRVGCPCVGCWHAWAVSAAQMYVSDCTCVACRRLLGVCNAPCVCVSRGVTCLSDSSLYHNIVFSAGDALSVGAPTDPWVRSPGLVRLCLSCSLFPRCCLPRECCPRHQTVCGCSVRLRQCYLPDCALVPHPAGTQHIAA